MSGVFDKYSHYYDLLYRDKDYAGEARFVHDCLLRYSSAPGFLLELGCGTGRHALEFAKLGWRVKGYDVSAGMVENARQRAMQVPADLQSKLIFDVGDIRSLRDPGGFDAVISLFHVISYQTTNNDLANAIATAAAHLRPGGLFLFDFWFGPAVLSDPPVVRIKRMQDELTFVTRLAEPEVDYTSNIVTLNYEILVENRDSNAISKIHEQHRMRYLFLPELEFFLNAHGLETAETGRWMDRVTVGKNTWYAWLLARKRAHNT